MANAENVCVVCGNAGQRILFTEWGPYFFCQEHWLKREETSSNQTPDNPNSNKAQILDAFSCNPRISLRGISCSTFCWPTVRIGSAVANTPGR